MVGRLVITGGCWENCDHSVTSGAPSLQRNPEANINITVLKSDINLSVIIYIAALYTNYMCYVHPIINCFIPNRLYQLIIYIYLLDVIKII